MTNASADRNLVPAVFLVGLSVVLLELTLTRIFSVVMWYHFASLSIAVALLGFALGGVLVTVRPRIIPAERFPSCLSPLLLTFAVTAAVPFALLGLSRARPSLLFPLMSFFHQPYYQPFRQAPPGPDLATILSLTALYAVVTLPFAIAGTALAGLFLRADRSRFGLLYGADLFGAAAACVLFVPGLKALGAPSLLLASAVAALAAAALLDMSRARRAAATAAAVVLLTIAVANGAGDRLVGLPFARGQYEPGILFSRWNALSRVVVYPLSRWESEQSWGIGRGYGGAAPDSMGMLVDDAGYAPIVKNALGETSPAWAPHHVISLGFALRPGADSLIIGPGGGRDIIAALAGGSRTVTAIELNPLIVEAVQDHFGSFSGRPYSLPGVTTIIGEGRSEMTRLRHRFDIILASSVFGEVSPSAGAFSLGSNFLYTREAFAEYWDSMKNDGILSLTRSVFGHRALRLVSLARDLLVSEGVQRPEDHIAVLRERGLATVLVSKRPFSASEVESLRNLADENGFTIETLPGLPQDTRFALMARGAAMEEGRFDLSPPTDDRPFFYNNVPRGRFFNVFFSPTEPGERHIIVLRTTALILGALVILLMAVPLLSPASGRPPAALIASSALYFAGIGLGYMLLELTLMHRLTLFLGHPTYSLTVVLVALLLFSGLGSVAAGRLAGWAKPWTRLLPLALILLSLVVERASTVLTPSLGMGIGVRVAVVCALLAIPGFAMGLFMPLGLSTLAGSSQGLVPWAWALNGAASVMGSIGSLVLAMNFGYTATFLVGAAAYALTVPHMRRTAAARNDSRKEDT